MSSFTLAENGVHVASPLFALGGGALRKLEWVQGSCNLFRTEAFVAPVVEPLVLEIVGQRNKVPVRLPTRVTIILGIISLESGKARRHDRAS